MDKIAIPYGNQQLHTRIPDGVRHRIVLPVEAPALPDAVTGVENALDAPLGDISFDDFSQAERVVIVVSDKTRPVPNHILLPPLLTRLHTLELSAEQITFLIATGMHPPMTPDEFTKILPADIVARYPIVSHDAEDEANLVHLGTTSYDGPIKINRHYVEADVRIVTGNIEPHQLAGFSGTFKSVVIGLGCVPFINNNHGMMGEQQVRLVQYHGNPIRDEIDEAGRAVGIDLALNSLLNGRGEVVRVLAGTPERVQQRGVELSRQIHIVDVPEKADVVISSPGGYPKDINMYQAQKGLAHAATVVKPGGTVILVAECSEGSGSSHFEEWMDAASSAAEVRQRFHSEGFQVGYHKAFQITRDMATTDVILVSSLPDELVRNWFFTPAPSLEVALSMALEKHGPDPTLLTMPKAASTVVGLANE